MGSHGGKCPPEKFSGVTLKSGRAWVPRTVPYLSRMARRFSLMHETVFVCRFLRTQSTSHLLTYFSLYFNPTRQLLISTKWWFVIGFMVLWAVLFFLKIVPHKLLNATKTQVMLLKLRGNDANPCVVKCKDTVLEVTQTAKYLGVIIDDKLTWQPHVDHLSRKCGQDTGQLWRSGRSFIASSQDVVLVNATVVSVVCFKCFLPKSKQ